MQRIGKSLPSIIPTNDVEDKWMTGRCAFIDLSHIASRAATGKTVKLKQAPEFCKTHVPSLLSTVTGVQ